MRAMLSKAGHAVTRSDHVGTPSKGAIRTCVGCRERADRSVLLRVVAAEVDGNWCVTPDPRHELPGRGASLHLDAGCFELAVRRRAFVRALRRGAPLDVAPVREYFADRSEPSSGKRVKS